MNASFEEKSVWIQLVSLVAVLGSYFAIAGLMLSKGVTVIVAYVPLFFVAVVLLVVVLVAGHVVAALASKPEGRDERDRLIGWRAESNSAWILAVGVCAAITGLVASIENVYIAHLLVLSMLLSEVAKNVFQLVYYRRGL
ncbi:hypothetical protein BWI17_03585 [Betaproteobacteria bacterium GR16-43]|nr:hypothetical protein BWI17_03585 [Betaproteobacteria bacterium GR16-43]